MIVYLPVIFLMNWCIAGFADTMSTRAAFHTRWLWRNYTAKDLIIQARSL